MKEMHKYEAFSEVDFMNDEYFQEWIINPVEEKNHFWKSLIDQYPGKAEIIEKAATMLRSIGFAENWPSDQKVEDSLEKALFQTSKYHQKVVELPKEPARVKSLYRNWWAAAAILLIVGAGSYLSN